MVLLRAPGFELVVGPGEVAHCEQHNEKMSCHSVVRHSEVQGATEQVWRQDRAGVETRRQGATELLSRQGDEESQSCCGDEEPQS